MSVAFFLSAAHLVLQDRCDNAPTIFHYVQDNFCEKDQNHEYPFPEVLRGEIILPMWHGHSLQNPKAYDPGRKRDDDI